MAVKSIKTILFVCAALAAAFALVAGGDRLTLMQARALAEKVSVSDAELISMLDDVKDITVKKPDWAEPYKAAAMLYQRLGEYEFCASYAMRAYRLNPLDKGSQTIHRQCAEGL